MTRTQLFSSGKMTYSKWMLGLIIILTWVSFFCHKRWEKPVIEWDVINYYAYLPATFIYHDLTFDFIDGVAFFDGKVWVEYREGFKVMKMTMGLSILYMPFFLIAHALAEPLGFPPDGYSAIYEVALLVSNICYVLLGVAFLRKILIRYFDEKISAFVMICISFGTNLFYYTMENAMAHSYLFALGTLFIYYTIRWHESFKIKHVILLGLLGGLITLIRPINMMFFFVWLAYGVYNSETLKQKVALLWNKKWHVLLMGILYIIVFSLQLSYWKYVTGNWWYWSYGKEGFFWANPHIIEGLFGFRKGWYIYVPVMFFATIGLFMVGKYIKEFKFILPLFWIVFTYIILCWWCWWYGGGLSIRPYIDIYVVMAIGLASLLTWAGKSLKAIRIIIPVLVLITASYGHFVVFQYREQILHHDGMNYEAWKFTFLRNKHHGGIWQLIEEPDYEKACATGKE